jgi:proline iminopeptidase
VLIHGRLDLASPLAVAEELAGAWPDARLVVVDDSGHTGSGAMDAEILDALNGFALG